MTTDAPKKGYFARYPKWQWAMIPLVLCGFLAYLASRGDDDAPTASAPAVDAPADAPAVEPTAAPTDAPPAPAFGDIEAKRAASTDLQWDDYAATLKGTRADGWPGVVREVKAKGDDVEVSVDLTPGGGLIGASDAFIRTSDPAARAFGKDQPVVVSGTIKRVGSVLGSIVVTFDDDATVAAAP